jgi:hypothetical protein
VRRLPAVVFAVLAAATVGAFFVVQHLKVSTPLIAGFPAPRPAVFNPRSGVVCGGVDYRRMQISFYLLHRSDDVAVYVIDAAGGVVATLASSRHMPRGVRTLFAWDGREDDGRFAPDGTYFIQVSLIHQGRTVVIAPTSGGAPTPVRIETRPPAPVVRAVTPRLVPVASSDRVHFRVLGTRNHVTTVRVYRTDLADGLRVVSRFLVGPSGNGTWSGRVGGPRAPAGIYLIGAEVTDAACNTGRFPRTLPPRPGTTQGAGVTVRYVAAQPPVAPARAGGAATVFVDARRRPYSWALRAAGSRRVLESGGPISSVALSLPLPAGAPGMYELSVRTGTHRAVVPVVASGAPAPLLVVLPAVTWQGRNAVDDDGDGMPNTLTAGTPVRLARPFATGLPAGWTDEVALLRYLRATHRRFELTTDAALAVGVGPAVSGHRGVVLAGDERWVPDAVAAALRRFVRGGGRVVSIGLHTLRASVRVSNGVAWSPSGLSSVDVFGLRHGRAVARDNGLASTESDGLSLFGRTAGVFSRLAAAGYEPVTGAVAPAKLASQIGTTPGSAMIAGARLGDGWVVEVGLRGFAARLSRSPDEQDILDGALGGLLARPSRP